MALLSWRRVKVMMVVHTSCQLEFLTHSGSCVAVHMQLILTFRKQHGKVYVHAAQCPVSASYLPCLDCKSKIIHQVPQQGGLPSCKTSALHPVLELWLM